MPIDDLTRAVEAATIALESVETAIKDATDAIDDMGGGGGGPGGGGPGGPGGGGGGRGAGGAGLAAIRRHPVGAAIAGTLAIAAPIAAAGAISATQGGTFEGGALAQLNRMASQIPFIGEISGLAGVQRIQDATQAGMRSDLGQLGRVVGPENIPQEAFDISLELQKKFAENFEATERKIKADIEEGFREDPRKIVRADLEAAQELVKQHTFSGIVIGFGESLFK